MLLKWRGFHRNMLSKIIEPAKPGLPISLHTPVLSLQRRNLRSRGSYRDAPPLHVVTGLLTLQQLQTFRIYQRLLR
jgi:hypothetical protein